MLVINKMDSYGAENEYNKIRMQIGEAISSGKVKQTIPFVE